MKNILLIIISIIAIPAILFFLIATIALMTSNETIVGGIVCLIITVLLTFSYIHLYRKLHVKKEKNNEVKIRKKKEYSLIIRRCTHCGKKIEKEINVCPNCGFEMSFKNQFKEIGKYLIIIILIIAFIGIVKDIHEYIKNLPNEPVNDSINENEVDSDTYVFLRTNTEKYVKEKLAFPNDAEFPFLDWDIQHYEEIYVVKTKVKVKNIYGAELTYDVAANYKLTKNQNTETYTLVYLRIGDNVY